MKKGSIASLTVAIVSLFAAASASALMPNCTPSVVTCLSPMMMHEDYSTQTTQRPADDRSLCDGRVR